MVRFVKTGYEHQIRIPSFPKLLRTFSGLKEVGAAQEDKDPVTEKVWENEEHPFRRAIKKKKKNSILGESQTLSQEEAS